MGKYIVCGEAHKEGHVVQANCFETVIDRLDNNSEMMMMICCSTNYDDDDEEEEAENAEYKHLSFR